MAVRRLKPSGSLKAYLDTSKRPTRLLGAVERHLITKPLDDRRQDVIHPSELVKSDFCRRASFYALTGRPRPNTRPSFQLQNVFDEGHAIHAKWQERFRDMGVLYGEWQCLECDYIWWGLAGDCPSCTADEKWQIRYNEVTLSSLSKYRISGHADGWIKGLGDDCLIEIKSIGAGTIRIEAPEIWDKAEGKLEEAWSNVKRPFATHIRQGLLYLELCQQMWHDVPEEIVFVYELKANQSVKEFTVHRTPELVEDMFDTAERVVRAVDKGIAPMCNVEKSGCAKCKAYEETR